jgi:uroporphyrinogen-III decarboxylase
MDVTNAQKRAVWDAYRAGRPTRVPVTFGINPRVVLLDPEWNPRGVTFRDCWYDARLEVETQLKFIEYQAEFLNRYCDSPTEWPERFDFSVSVQNVYDSAYFGGPVEFRDGQVPDVSRTLEGADRERIFEVDIDHPMDNPFVQESLRRHEDLKRAAAGVSFHDVRLGVAPVIWGFDGPLTVATNLRGSEVYLDLAADPDYAGRLFEFITRGVIIRNRAMNAHFGRKAFDAPCGSLADDSVELISTDMYRRMILPHHRTYLSQWSVDGPHSMHLCGDATRHFSTIRDELHVNSFDTGFPVDHGALRKALGPDVQIQGGPEVSVLHDGTPAAVYERTRGILQSGVMDGGRFILREANNLPPGCPAENLEAMYRACLDHGCYAAHTDERQ